MLFERKALLDQHLDFLVQRVHHLKEEGVVLVAGIAYKDEDIFVVEVSDEENFVVGFEDSWLELAYGC